MDIGDVRQGADMKRGGFSIVAGKWSRRKAIPGAVKGSGDVCIVSAIRWLPEHWYREGVICRFFNLIRKAERKAIID